MMPIDLPVKAPVAKEWEVTGRFVLISVVLFFLVIASVNAVMMTLAIRTFPGVDARNGFDKSQNYNREIAAARGQAERGWMSEIALSRGAEDAALVLTLKDRQGVPVSGLGIAAQIAHPTSKAMDRSVVLNEVAPGRYEAALAIAPGAWNISLEGQKDGQRVYNATSRAIVK